MLVCYMAPKIILMPVCRAKLNSVSILEALLCIKLKLTRKRICSVFIRSIHLRVVT